MQLEKRNPDYQTIVSVVYVTASKTFSGEVGGYVTLDGSQSSTSASAQKGTPIQQSATASTTASTQVKGTPVQQSAASSSSTDDSSDTDSVSVPTRAQRPDHASSSTTLSTATVVSSSASASASAGTPIALTSAQQTSIISTSSVVSQQTTLVSSVVPVAAAVSSTALASISATAVPVAHAAEGPSTGAKAGIAIGIILAFAIIAGLVLFLVRRKRNNNSEDSQRLDDEKRSAARQSTTSVSSSRFSVAKSVLSLPRLSLGPTVSEKQERPTLNHTDSLTNPFEDAKHEVMTDNQIKSMITVPIPAPLNFNGGRPVSPNPVVLNAPAAGRTSPSGPVVSNVHRVQLDFKPSMDDELELKSGQIIRMLHEYDDGWVSLPVSRCYSYQLSTNMSQALCKRLDGTQQGVVPRSCLSKLPLKRRDGPPGGPRPTNGKQQAPGHRVPSGGSVSSVNSYLSEEAIPRPLSPAGRMRAQSSASNAPPKYTQTNEDARQRANSAGAATKLAAGAAMSPLNPAIQRRPVPGSAM